MATNPPNPQTAPTRGGFDPTQLLERIRDDVRRLRQRFARRRSAIQTRHGAELLDGNSMQPRWIVARSLCMYRSEDFANIPRNRRDAAVALKIPVWSPFEHVGHYCTWSGTTAMVWFWDAATIEADLALLGLPAHDATRDKPPSGVRTLPETVLYPKPPAGVHVQECREGFDLQYWRNGLLVDSLWLARRPDARRVHAFAAPHAADETVAAPHAVDEKVAALATGVELRASSATFATDPWPAPLRPRAWLLENERALVVAALAIFAAVAAFQEARFWRYHFAHASDATEFRRINRELDPIIEARDELVALNRLNAFLAGVANHPTQAELMMRVDRALPGEATQFRAWRYQQRDLAVDLTNDAGENPVAIIEGLQTDPLFADVRPGRSGPDGLEVRLRIQPDATP